MECHAVTWLLWKTFLKVTELHTASFSLCSRLLMVLCACSVLGFCAIERISTSLGVYLERKKWNCCLFTNSFLRFLVYCVEQYTGAGEHIFIFYFQSNVHPH